MNRTATFFLELAVGVTLLADSGATALARSRATEGPEVQITLRAYDYAHANRFALLDAEDTATAILGQAGIAAQWVDCPTSSAQLQPSSGCRQGWQASDLIIRVIPRAMADRLNRPREAVGYAIDGDGTLGQSAYVFYDGVSNLRSGQTAALSVLLGRVMAHEIGHMLLGTNSH